MSFTDICIGHTIVPDQFVVRGILNQKVLLTESWYYFLIKDMNKLYVLSHSMGRLQLVS